MTCSSYTNFPTNDYANGYLSEVYQGNFDLKARDRDNLSVELENLLGQLQCRSPRTDALGAERPSTCLVGRMLEGWMCARRTSILQALRISSWVSIAEKLGWGQQFFASCERRVFLSYEHSRLAKYLFFLLAYDLAEPRLSFTATRANGNVFRVGWVLHVVLQYLT